MKTRIILPTLVMLALASISGRAATLGTEFTYQGRLTDGTNVANGIYDLRFYLRDDATAGNPVGLTNTLAPTGVTNGLFTVTLDFGAGIFTGDARWLEIGVRSNGSVGAYTTLSPRQPLTPTPYAIYATNAGAAITAVSAAGVGLNAVGTSGLQNNAVDSSKIADGTIVNADINAAAGIADTKLATLSAAGKVANSATTATSANTPNTIVARDPAGSFSAGNVTATAFNGNGAGLTSLNAGNLTGPVPVAALSNAWRIGGNAGTPPGVNFLGTVDNQALQLKVNNTLALEIRPGVTLPNIVGGLAAFRPSVIASGVSGAVIAGGNAPSGGVNGFGGGDFQAVYDDDGSIGGGFGNKVGSANADVTDAAFATVAGGVFNWAANYAATVAGGDSNFADGQRAAVLGGYANQARGAASAVGGGLLNGIRIGADYSIIGGGANNLIQSDVVSSIIGGGSQNTIMTGGTFGPTITPGATIGGGSGNTIQGFFDAEFGFTCPYATISGGYSNNIHIGSSSTIGGGQGNTTYAGSDTISGGYGNSAGDAYFGGHYATVPGGYINSAVGNYSFAAGRQAKALHNGSFVWADSAAADFASTAINQFSIRAAGGVRLNTDTSLVFGNAGSSQLWPDQGGAIELGNSLGNGNTPYIDFHYGIGIAQDYSVRLVNDAPGFLTCSGVFQAPVLVQTSDRNAKQNFKPVKPREVLEKVSALPITEWDFKQGPGTRHLGPMAQDFRAAFGLGTDDKHIATVDEGGVALAAIQGLNEIVQEKDSEIRELKQRMERLERIISERLGGGK